MLSSARARHERRRRRGMRGRPLVDRLAGVPTSSEVFAVTNPIVRRCKGNRALAHAGAAGY